MEKISKEVIEQFINGDDPMERIVNIEYKTQDDYVTIYYRDEQDRKCTVRESFYPFVWARRDACLRLCEGDRSKLKQLMNRCHIGVKKLSNVSIDGVIRHEFDDGYMFMFYAKSPMSYADFTSFFKWAKNPLYPKKDKYGKLENPALENQYIVVKPIEQFMIATGKRFFKGYDDYDDILRMTFDLETTGLDTEKDRIVQIGVRFNRPFYGMPNGFERIFTVEGNTEQERNANELKAIETFFKIIYTFKPDVITGHNSENFDWNIFIGACKRLGTSIEELTSKYFDGEPVRKNEKESILKLGGEMEVFHETIVPHTITTDSLHAVRRGQAIDSNLQRADLKYVTEYNGLKKPNRVYTPGSKISEIWADKVNKYAFCEEDGDWYIYDEENGDSVKTRDDFATDEEYQKYLASIKGKQGDQPFKLKKRNVLLDGYEITTGKYIIERYLLDDLYEGDRVEWKYNSTNFLICKLLPLPYKKCTTMGTAGLWKALMMAWSYRNELAIPPIKDTGSFTGGLSRLLKTGYVTKIIKLDFNSLYPSIILTWGICDTNDLMNSMLAFLEYILTTREKYKNEKKKAEKLIDKYKTKVKDGVAKKEEIEVYQKSLKDFSVADGRQNQFKNMGNSYFGSLGSLKGSAFPWKSAKSGEQTTCTGRQCLRLMISHFAKLGYDPIVGDSVTGDTPLFIKYKNNGLIDIKPISEIMDIKNCEIDALGRHYDATPKPYHVLCRSGWSDVSYVYCHETDKDMYRVSEEDMLVDVTQDHSLFDEDMNEIKPTEIKDDTKLEYYKKEVKGDEEVSISPKYLSDVVKGITNGSIDRVPVSVLNSNNLSKILLLKGLRHKKFKITEKHSKTLIAGLHYLERTEEEFNKFKENIVYKND